LEPVDTRQTAAIKWIAECRLSTRKRIAAALGVGVKELFTEAG